LLDANSPVAFGDFHQAQPFKVHPPKVLPPIGEYPPTRPLILLDFSLRNPQDRMGILVKPQTTCRAEMAILAGGFSGSGWVVPWVCLQLSWLRFVKILMCYTFSRIDSHKRVPLKRYP